VTLPKSKESKEIPKLEDKLSKKKLTFSGRSLRNKKWLSMMNV